MGQACPRCKELSQPLRRYWENLAPGSESKARWAPPPEGTLNWIPAVACAAVALLLLVNGSILFGLLALVATGVVSFHAYQSYSSAQAKLQAWREARYCQVCDQDFPPDAALVV